MKNQTDMTTNTLTLSPEVVKIIETALTQGKELKIRKNKDGGITILDVSAKRIY